MPRFNPDKIARLVSEMRRAVGRLRALGSVDKGSFLNNPDKIGSAKYNFIVAIESAMSVTISYRRMVTGLLIPSRCLLTTVPLTVPL